ncbi:MAG: DNA polymerase III subunit gamma/tau [Clostridia bacterium]|nr:DNA polymerase III subunit gamma/tau [Clostridia bacterium]
MYQSLYRKYRPDTFEKVIGQEHITTTLVNQIRTGNIAHAYLLTGTRGTGKTSVARIFARAVNCLSPVNGSPCGECEVCKKLLSGTSLDVVEIDAASNNSVEDARSIRDSVRYAPIDCKYKVYIIDEVHQLSQAAFNALLKTLEEPPAHAIFILATTEVQKIPATILSRCLRLDFHLVSQELLEKHVAEIFDKEGISYTKEGVSAIAAAGAGSVRDTLSVADMCASYSDVVNYDCVLGVLGANDPSLIAAIALCALSGDIKNAITRVESASSLGKSMQVLTKDLTKYFRDLIIIKNDDKANEVLRLPDHLFTVAREIAVAYDGSVLMRALDIFSNVEAKERYSAQPKILLESAIIKTATLSGEDFSDLLARVATLENKVKEFEGSPAARPDYTAILSSLSAVQKQTVVEKPAEKAPVEEKPEQKQDAAEVIKGEKKEIPVFPTLKETASVELPFETESASSPILSEAKAPEDLPFDVPAEDPQEPVLTNADVKNLLPKEVKDEIKKLRGRLINRLRERKQLMLYLAVCEEGTLIKVENGKIVMAFQKESDYNYCNNPQVKKYLQALFAEELNFDCDLSLLMYDDHSPNSISNADILKLFAGADSVNFKNVHRR